jgi:hypothetical protein
MPPSCQKLTSLMRICGAGWSALLTAAIEAADLLSDHLDLTVMLAQPDIATRRDLLFQKARSAWFGDSAEPAPSSRSSLKLRLSRDSAISIVLDVWGGSPLFAAADLREAICGPIRVTSRSFSRHC